MKLFELLDTQYNKFTTTIKTYLSKELNDNNSNYSNNTIFGQLLNVINAISQNIMLYIEDAFVEQNKYTAQRKKSIYGLAALSGYEPSLGKASGVQIKLSFKPSNIKYFNIIIKNKTKLICTQNGLNYNLVLPQDSIILSVENSCSKILCAVEGRYESQRFISAGGKYYTKNINPISNIDVDYLEVKINNKKWDRVASTYDMCPNGEQYTIKTAYNGGIDLIFGNDKYGKSLKNGDVIDVTYLLHNGEQGNIDSNQKTFFAFSESISDVSGQVLDGNQIFNMILANDEAVAAGTDNETTAHVKSMIGYNSRSLVLASPNNYKQFLNNFSFCGYNRTWLDPDSLNIKSLIIKNYKQNIDKGKQYFNLSESDFILSKQQKSSIKNCIRSTGNQLAGTTYDIIDPKLCKYALYLYIKLKIDSADTDFIKEQIKNIVGDFFCNIYNDMFIPKSDIIYELKSKIDSIDGISAYFLSEKNEIALQTKNYDKVSYIYNPVTNSYEKQVENIKLYGDENPNLGLDSHGNILLENNEEFPVLMGGWSFNKNKQDNQQIIVNDPLVIVFE